MNRVRANIKVSGIVQGVGFRPFIHKLANEKNMAGWIRNTEIGAEIEIEGFKEDAESFISDISLKAPYLAAVESVDAEFFDELKGFTAFEILESSSGGERKALISPDSAVCEDCLREMNDPKDRRFGYPFINCTNCGPRFTIIKDIPYDRKNTTMAQFEMCPECKDEYGNIEDRRYHAQPDCCPKCGPSLEFLGKDGKHMEGDAILLAQEALEAGKIVAVKGLGGFHLACRMDSEETADRLRKRKQRDEKPFAVMCRDIEAVREIAAVSEEEESALLSRRRSIVLLSKKNKDDYPYLSENGFMGVMLPYTPVHYLLLKGNLKSLIMTSANLSDLPIIYKNEEALKELGGIADGFLMNNREIETRCDDSLIRIFNGKEYPIRRSRGYVPYPLTMKGADGILALGAEQKASFALAKDGYVFPSQHIGDLKNIETYENYAQQISHFERLFDADIKTLCCDLHPDFMSTDYALQRAQAEGLNVIRAAHHHAHMASCMADNCLEGKCIGIIWDGTGLGTDGTIWGSEFLVGDYKDFVREGSFKPIKLPGGDLAVKEIYRVGVSLLEESGVSVDKVFQGESADRARAQLQADINCPPSSGMGRLFDGICAILGIKEVVSYEGQGAVLLEAAAGNSEGVYPYEIIQGDINIIDTSQMVRKIAEDKLSGRDISLIAADFMNTLVMMAAHMCCIIREKEGIERVVLSGGSFQNMYMLERLSEKLKDNGFDVYCHSRVSCNDEGISFGQMAIALARKSEKEE